MNPENKSPQELHDELTDLRQRLEEAEETLRAIREGEVDAVVVATPAGNQVYTLKGADETYRRLIEAINEGVALLAPDGDILYANHKLAQLLALPLEQVIGSSMRRHIAAADQETFDALFAQAHQPGTGEVYLLAGDGTRTPVQLSLGSLQLDNSPGALSLVVTDLTPQKRNEAIVAEGRLCSQILIQAEQPIIVCDESGQIIRASQGAHRLCTQNPLFCSFLEAFPLRRPSASELFSPYESMQGKLLAGEEMICRHQDGRESYFLMNAGSLEIAGQESRGCVVALTDITARKRAEETIKASLQEKEILLQEIHHRTKNNMNVISSLLSLQSLCIDDDKVKQVFQETQNRIRSMALVHEKLYQANDLGNIDLGEYITDLTNSVMANYQLSKREILLIPELDSISVNIETAMPCGLIINELISNALKYAFPGTNKGTISVSLHRTTEGVINLSVADNGVGLPPDIDIMKTKSLGMRLVTNLVEHQLEGDLELHTAGGTEFRIRFQELH